MRRNLLVMLVGVGAMMGAAGGEPPERVDGAVVPRVMAPVQRELLVEAIDEFASQRRFWGGVLVMLGDETLVKRGFGQRLPSVKADEPGSEPIDGSTVFEIASIAKVFTGVAIMQLVEAGELSLDDPIEKPLAKIDGLGGLPSGIRVRELLSHTSGRDGGSAMPPYSEQDRDKVVRAFFTSTSSSRQGSRFSYNNHAYLVLAAMIEEVSGQAFETYMRERIFVPAGMTSTGFLGDAALRSRGAARDERSTQVDFFWGWGYRGAGGIVSTLDDLGRFRAALRDGKVLPRARVEEMWRPVLETGRGAEESIGLAWFVSGGPQPANLASGWRLSHTGGSAGVRCSLVWYPEVDALVVVLSGGTSDPTGMSHTAEMQLLRGLAP